ncbi:hypothetical protein I3J27_33730 [Bradyrhizobium xenonodulans]|uniref:Uncharacterized protein n=1 Tax=Bradyrhizobium xenonodulans TaxID=2736875 RepID=A0ABY7MLU0_9BRAD|nr:hypothetical protein [Bradyrhizobium xenonodulans]WBL77890.1 hypothetical protein I3J27_33730 [Bradyrhizobium xenonodulans]
MAFAGKTAVRTQCGILMYSSLAVTTEAFPLGLAAIKFWSAKRFKGMTALKRKINLTWASHRAEGEYPLTGEFTASRCPKMMHSYR